MTEPNYAAEEDMDFPEFGRPTTLTAPHNGTATSRDAADRIRPKLGRQLAMVYAVIVVGGEVTEREIEEATGLRGDSVRPRLRHLQGVAYGNRPKPPVLIETCGVKNGMTLYRAISQSHTQERTA